MALQVGNHYGIQPRLYVPEQIPEPAEEVNAGEGSGTVRVERNDVLPLGMLDVLSAADLEGPEVVCATFADSVAIAEKCWKSNQC